MNNGQYKDTANKINFLLKCSIPNSLLNESIEDKTDDGQLHFLFSVLFLEEFVHFHGACTLYIIHK